MLTGRALLHIARHRSNARLSRDELLARNLVRFRQLAAFARERSRYYARVMRERGIDPARARPEDFPVLTKPEFLAHFDEIATDPRVRTDKLTDFLARSRDPRELYAGRFHVLQTSGTSGTVCYMAYSRAEWMRGISHFERVVRLGWRKRIAFVGAVGGHYASVSLATAPSSALARLFYVRRAIDINRPLDELVRDLNAFQPRVLMAYARALRPLAEAQEQGKLRIRPRVVFATGEAAPAHELAYVQATFRAQLRSVYAACEHLFMGFDLPFADGMYLLEDDLIFEPRPDCVYVTNLFARTVPLIRYRMDDILEPPADRRAANGPYRVVGTVVGRSEHTPVFENDRGEREFIHPNVLASFHVRHLKAFQVRLRGRTGFDFKAVLAEGLAPAQRECVETEIAAGLRALLDQKRLGNVTFTIEQVDGLGCEKSGKFRLVVPAEPG